MGGPGSLRSPPKRGISSYSLWKEINLTQNKKYGKRSLPGPPSPFWEEKFPGSNLFFWGGGLSLSSRQPNEKEIYPSHLCRKCAQPTFWATVKVSFHQKGRERGRKSLWESSCNFFDKETVFTWFHTKFLLLFHLLSYIRISLCMLFYLRVLNSFSVSWDSFNCLDSAATLWSDM